MSFEISERWLMDSGGWQAMKAARAAWQSGAVIAAEFDGTRLRGHIKSAGRTLAAGLVIRSRTDVANLCSCPVSRRGSLCEHSLAIGLAWAHRSSTEQSSKANRPASASLSPPAKSAPATTTPVKREPPATSGALAVSLPANFFEGLKRSRLAASLRLATGNESESAADRALHTWLAAQNLTQIPPQIALATHPQIESFLSALVSHPRISVSGQPWRVDGQGSRLPLRICQKRKKNGFSTDNKSVTESSKASKALSLPNETSNPGTASIDAIELEIDLSDLGSITWWSGSTIGVIQFLALRTLFIIRYPDVVSPFFDASGNPQPAAVPFTWLARQRDILSEVFKFDDADPDWPSIHVVPVAPRFRLALDGSLRRMTGVLWCAYPGAAEFRAGAGRLQPDPFPIADPSRPGAFFDRSPDVETAAARRLERAGFVFSAVDNQFILNGEQAVFAFFADDLARLESEWSIDLSASAATAFRGLERVTPEFREVASGSDWLAFDLAFAGSAGSRISAADARRWLQGGQGGRRLPNGRMAVLAKEAFADLEEVLKDLSPRQEQGHFRIAAAHRTYLENSLPGGTVSERLNSGAGLIDSLDARGHSVLRPYQRAGVEWMLGLAGDGWGGILADEMGLGKTLQSLAVIDTLKRAASTRGAPQKPCLVVVPTSLLGNWQEEAGRFAPNLRVVVLRSGERTRQLAAAQAADLVITSYQLVIRDQDHHRATDYAAVFLDEAGFIRNPETQASQAVRRLRADTRFALTGTPIENSIRDLWAIMEFALPGYLGSRDDFQQRYESSIQSGDPAALQRLRRRMAAFWLRRLKQDVARDLPSKIEKIIRCELTPTQRDIYTAIHREGVRSVEEARRTQSAGQARFTLLTALLRLRQTCGDPRLLGESFPDQDPAEFSGKWAALAELLEEIRDGGHNVLIFSQFARQIDLLEPALTAAGLDFCRLDGTTRDRDAQVAAFQSAPAKRAFLISLKAGGFGLNLTKADTVIHFDPWWNPAVEAQATDRAHRIGQARPVTVYKLITTATVEEKILSLQLRKRQLMSSALADDTSPLMDELDDSALQQLLVPAE